MKGPLRVQVALEDVKGQCTVTSLDGQKSGLQRHKIRAQVGQTVVWIFENHSGQDVAAEISNFRFDDDIRRRHGVTVPMECRDPDPFTGSARVEVPKGKAASMERQVTALHYPRTYKYDIVVVGKDGKRSVLDPEAEIYR